MENRLTKVVVVKGLIAAPGMAYASSQLISELKVDIEKRVVDDASSELARLKSAISDCIESVERLMEGMEGDVDPQTIEILDFQALMLEDTDFIGGIEKLISERLVNAEHAVKTASDAYISDLEKIEGNDYLRERAADVADLSQRLIAILSGADLSIEEPDGDYIAIGADIAPSRVAELDKRKLKGIILEQGGITSHCVILANSLGIPCLIRTAGILEAAQSGGAVLLDAESGEAIMDPGADRIRAYEEFVARDAENKASLREYANRASITPDGAQMKVFANITSKDEAENAANQGCEGVGLFRSELLFMAQSGGRPPSEERQYAEYAGAAKALAGKPLIIRTLDLGGDKQISYMDIGAEDNPFLGYRAIRYCLDHAEIFLPQIAAILRAGAGVGAAATAAATEGASGDAATAGNVMMMFPMVTCMEELRKAKRLVELAKEDLSSRGLPYDRAMKVGIMVETPAAALDAEILAKEADFFSIGTNDLTQYLFAADRSNPKMVSLNSHFQPALLRAVHGIVTAAHRAGIEADICGQAAEVENLVPVWLAIGVDALSVSVPRASAVRKRICNTRKSACDELLVKVLQLETAQEVEKMLEDFKNSS
jgi:phosphotransferase system enzyme I (PtsI)